MSYKRPPNLKDSIVRADIRLKKEKQQPNLPNPDFLKQSGSKVLAETQLKQTTITNFFNPEEEPSTSTLRNSSTSENTNSIFIKRTCLNIKCKYCPYINKSGQILCHSTKYTHQTKYNVTCQSSNVIYCITCKRCGQHYVGQTKRKLFLRLREHLRSIITCPDDINPLPVGQHFSQKDHKGKLDLEIQVLDFGTLHPDSEKSEILRKKVEKKWIHTLRSPAPDGMNILD